MPPTNFRYDYPPLLLSGVVQRKPQLQDKEPQDWSEQAASSKLRQQERFCDRLEISCAMRGQFGEFSPISSRCD